MSKLSPPSLSSSSPSPQPTSSPKPPARHKPLTLQAERIVETAARLELRIAERFGEASLRKVAVEVHAVSLQASRIATEVSRPRWWLRIFVVLLLALAVGPLVVIAARVKAGDLSFAEAVQTTDAALQCLTFLGIAAIFLWSVETRLKRARLLAAIRVLRALAHIVDMHQLTKDPEAVLRPRTNTTSSPVRILDRFMLGRYLDYCSELLSLISKIGAIYIQDFPDPVAMAAADQLSSLTNDLSRNVWQKIMILDTLRPGSEPVAVPAGTPAAGDEPEL